MKAFSSLYDAIVGIFFARERADQLAFLRDRIDKLVYELATSEKHLLANIEEIRLLRAKIADLETEKRVLQAKCDALELEKINLKSEIAEIKKKPEMTVEVIRRPQRGDGW